MPSIPQASTIVFFLIVGFLIFITLKGELPQYQEAIFGGASGSSSSSTTQTPSNTPASGPQSIAPLPTLS